MSNRSDFIEAVQAGNLVAVKRLIPEVDLCPCDWDEPDEHPLLVACATASPDVVAIACATVSAEDAERHHFFSRDEAHSLTLLACALLHGNFEVAKWLVERGADVNAEFRTTLADAEELEIATFFGDYAHGRSIGICWWLADEVLLEKMQGYGLRPDIAPRNGNSALINAIARSNVKRVKQVLHLGADPDYTITDALAESTGYALPSDATALMYAAFLYYSGQSRSRRSAFIDVDRQSARLEIVACLLRSGASLSPEFSDYVDGMKSGATVCDWVLEYGDEALLELFGLQSLRARLREEADERAYSNCSNLNSNDLQSDLFDCP